MISNDYLEKFTLSCERSDYLARIARFAVINCLTAAHQVNDSDLPAVEAAMEMSLSEADALYHFDPRDAEELPEIFETDAEEAEDRFINDISQAAGVIGNHDIQFFRSGSAILQQPQTNDIICFGFEDDYLLDEFTIVKSDDNLPESEQKRLAVTVEDERLVEAAIDRIYTVLFRISAVDEVFGNEGQE